MPASEPCSLAEELYLALHYDAVTGELLRNGKVNGSEVHALSAAKLIDLTDRGLVEVARGRKTPRMLVAVDSAAGDAALDEARITLLAQSKERSVGWGLANLGAPTLIAERLVAAGILVDERRPASPLTAAGLEVLRARRAELDTLVLGDKPVGAPAFERAALIAAILYAGKVWRNVYVVTGRAEKDALGARLALVTKLAVHGGDRGAVIERLLADAVAP